jgi:hypothetical protein
VSARSTQDLVFTASLQGTKQVLAAVDAASEGLCEAHMSPPTLARYRSLQQAGNDLQDCLGKERVAIARLNTVAQVSQQLPGELRCAVLALMAACAVAAGHV